MSPEISQYEPRGALDGGPDGLDFYRRLARGCVEFLADGGFLALEIGNGQAPDIIGLLTEAGFGDVESIDDYSGTARVVVASRPAGGCRVLKTVQCRGADDLVGGDVDV